MNVHHSPKLDPWQTADLAATADPALEGRLLDHGVSLPAAVTESSDWLTAAIVAGYVATIDGIELALRAYQQFCLAMGALLEETGDSLVGPAWTARIDYPRLTNLLKELIVELENRFGDLDAILDEPDGHDDDSSGD